MNLIPRNLWFPILLLPSALLWADGGKTLYRWVDEKGEVHYSDQIPPQYAPTGHDVITDQGVTVEKIPRAKTKEEIAAEAAQQAAEQAAKTHAEETQAAREAADRRLREAYGSADSIRNMLAEKTALIDSTVRLAENRITKLQDDLKRVGSEAARQERSGNPVAEDIKKQMASLHDQIVNNQKFIADQHAEQQRLKAQFEADLKRYLELTGQAPSATD
jgi:chromosome segregation ATPase